MCSKCGINERRPGHSWCKPCLNAKALEYHHKVRPRERTEVRVCSREGCERTFTWRSTHGKQKYCSKECYTQGVLDERKAKRLQRVADAAMVGKQRCSHCGEVKDDDEFNKPRQCRSCAAEINRQWRERHPERFKLAQRRSAQKRRLVKYGLTEQEYAHMLIEQSGLCAICSIQLDPDHVDHDHQTGIVRGLLCNKCNTRLHDGVPLHWYDQAARYLARTMTEV